MTLSTNTTIPLPTWVQEIRPHQADAVAEAVEHYRAGVKVVMLDGPTGTGKTLIGEMVRRELATNALYICTDKALQDQFAQDFRYARVLKGRANYPTSDGPDTMTADDCTQSGSGGVCLWCEQPNTCPYKIAKDAAAKAALAVLNTSYLLAEANSRDEATFSRRPFIIADEADQLERSLLGYVEYQVPQYVLKDLRLEPPKKGAHKPTLVAWLAKLEHEARQLLAGRGTTWDEKRKRQWRLFVASTRTMQAELAADIERAADAATDEGGRWLRDYDTRTFKMVPVTVASYGAKRLWRHGHRWLLMSATLISPDQMAQELGLPWPFEVVSVPMTFPVENRPIFLAGIANITYQADDSEYYKLALAVANIAERHPDERILVHTVSYKLTEKLGSLLRPMVFGRPIISYSQARDKQDALDRYRRLARSILLAPSVTRGVDLADDDCRVVVIAKVPYPSFGDRRVAARVKLPGGDAWYTVQTVREIVQMTGRGVRSADDHAVSYILDRQFMTNTWKRGKHLFPQWWRDAVDPTFNPRQLMTAL